MRWKWHDQQDGSEVVWNQLYCVAIQIWSIPHTFPKHVHRTHRISPRARARTGKSCWLGNPKRKSIRLAIRGALFDDIEAIQCIYSLSATVYCAHPNMLAVKGNPITENSHTFAGSSGEIRKPGPIHCFATESALKTRPRCLCVCVCVLSGAESFSLDRYWNIPNITWHKYAIGLQYKIKRHCISPELH